MLLRLLGPIEVGGASIAAAKHRSLLTALAIGRGQAADADQLIDDLWGESPPTSAPKLLQVYVSQLRKLLPPGARIVTRPAGYALEVDPAEVDVAVFERLVVDGRGALRSGNAALAASLLRRSLDLWRGQAFGDIRFEAFAADEARRLEGLRDTARLDRIDADLRLGRHTELLGELDGLLANDPADERLAAFAVLATYRASGAADAR